MVAGCVADGNTTINADGFYGIGSGSMVNGDMQQTTYNHLFPPNSKIVDCDGGGYIDSNNEAAIMSARSRHPGIVNVVAADGSVRAVKSTVNAAVWQAFGTAKGGEIISADCALNAGHCAGWTGQMRPGVVHASSPVRCAPVLGLVGCGGSSRI